MPRRYDPGVPALDDATFAVLHEVRLRGVVMIEDDDALAPLFARGLVARATRGVRITPVGREQHARWARLESGSDAEQIAQRAYERFLPLNRELIRICHDWQHQPGEWTILDRLRAVDERIAPVVTHVSHAVARFEVYRPTLREALTHVDAGAHEWVASPRCDSYHTAWMRLHEDLLLALGLDRAAEPEP